MFVTTTPAQRDIIKIALLNQKKIANDLFSILKRLVVGPFHCNRRVGSIMASNSSYFWCIT